MEAGRGRVKGERRKRRRRRRGVNEKIGRRGQIEKRENFGH